MMLLLISSYVQPGGGKKQAEKSLNAVTIKDNS